MHAMFTILHRALVTSLIVGVLSVPKICCSQDNSKTDQSTVKSKDDRIHELERRIEILEQVVFATSKLSVFDAERNLQAARNRLADSKKLFLKGFITDIQLEQDRFHVDRARREIELARATSGSRRVAMEIDLMQAKHNLKLSKYNLQHTRQLAGRGYSSVAEIADEQKRVDRAEKNLQLARLRLEALDVDAPDAIEKPDLEIDDSK